jgi:GTPase SAR1 family protein
MKNKTIKVVVLGPAGSGKSTIIYAMREKLKELGLECEFDGGMDYDDEDDFDVKIGSHFTEAVEAIKKKTHVTFAEVQSVKDLANRNEVV